MWISIKALCPNMWEHIDVEIRHCNDELNLENQIVTGFFGSDCFYLEGGGELSHNWDIVRWRIKN